MQHDLTDALIRTLRAPAGGRLEIWDKRCEGLVLRVSDKGRVTWHARARGPDGRKRFASLGVWPALSLSDARTEARIHVGQMQKGADPTELRRAERERHARAAAMPTLRELGQLWAKAHARDTSVRYRDELLAAVGRGCGDAPRRASQSAALGPDLMRRRIDSVTVNDVAAAVQTARARGDGEARHLVRALRRLFGFAVATSHIQMSPVDVWLQREKGGRRSIPWMRDGIRERVLADAELMRLWRAAALFDETARRFTRIMILSACRSGELAGLSWHEIERGPGDNQAQSSVALLLPPSRTKNGRPHRIPLGSLAADELRDLVDNADLSRPKSSLVFPGIPSRTAGLCRALRQSTGIADWSWHDLRRTAATGMARLGCPREHVEAALNHISARGGLVGIYQRHSFDGEAAAALLRWQAHVKGLLSNPDGTTTGTTRMAAD
jgi:integrase